MIYYNASGHFVKLFEHFNNTLLPKVVKWSDKL